MNPCATCDMRKKIRNGCCVQENHPDEFLSKTVVQRRLGKIVRRIDVCEHLDATTGECLNYGGRPDMCKAVNERLCY